jgi:protein-tyrosine phosphatase
MAQDTRLALSQFISALERHFEAVATRRSAEDPSVQTAYLQLEDAFLNYEELLAENFEEYLPFELAEDDSE